jgi:hypothetical protein
LEREERHSAGDHADKVVNGDAEACSTASSIFGCADKLGRRETASS